MKAKLRLRVFSETLYLLNKYRMPPLIPLLVVCASKIVQTIGK